METKVLKFVEWWLSYREMLTPEQWYELEGYIFKFEFDEEYTDPSEIKDKVIRSAWLGISEYMMTMEYSIL